MGDFNLTRSPRDRSNDNFNDLEAGLLNGIIEIPLLDCHFTWSNQQHLYILVHFDRVMVNENCSLALLDSTFTSSIRPIFDHVPLHLEASSKAPISTIFCLDSTWLSHGAFVDIANANLLSLMDCHNNLPHTGLLCLRLKCIRSAAHARAPPLHLYGQSPYGYPSFRQAGR
jgi:hypothetical protein